jgi:UMF1 family MFS transporter
MFLGISSGVGYASSRAYLAVLITAEESGKYFGLYTLAERFASVIGPLLWGIIVWCLSPFYPWNYRFAALAMAILVFTAVIPLLKDRAIITRE